MVVGIDGSASSEAALGLAFEEADLRGAALRAVSVWQPSVFMLHGGKGAVQAQRRMLSETMAGWSPWYPDVPPGKFRQDPCGRPRHLRPREWPGPEAAPENGPGEALEQ
ncbi:universal stress protein [Streptomyces sp. NPDC006510]|uniref:universal stress protein n=1 Tax=Streptomyces sp. NPDC006510 TaxID=3155600 RepID=UPI0033AD50AA